MKGVPLLLREQLGLTVSEWLQGVLDSRAVASWAKNDEVGVWTPWVRRPSGSTFFRVQQFYLPFYSIERIVSPKVCADTADVLP